MVLRVRPFAKLAIVRFADFTLFAAAQPSVPATLEVDRDMHDLYECVHHSRRNTRTLPSSCSSSMACLAHVMVSTRLGYGFAANLGIDMLKIQPAPGA
jgi:hypothetical protein